MAEQDNTLSKPMLDIQSKTVNNVRGEQPIDIKEKCLDLCQRFLSGIWTKLTINEIEVKRLTGGASNQVYHCRVVNTCDETQEVAIRLYGKKIDFTFQYNEDRLDDALLGLFASNAGIGPHIYGLFKEGEIQKFYQHRVCTSNDMDDENLLRQLACKLARYHSLNAPVKKESDFIKILFTNSSKRYKDSAEKYRKLFEMFELKTLLECDFQSEIDFILKVIPTFDSPIVLSHNDFRFANCMITDDNTLIIGDYELSSYYKRGLDFASLFYMASNGVSEELIRKFITEYIKEGESIYGITYTQNEKNSIEHILCEMRQYTLVYMMYFINLFLHNDYFQYPFDVKTCMVIVNQQMDAYLKYKTFLIESKLIK